MFLNPSVVRLIIHGLRSREYCDACDTTFETHRDLIVHRCLSITDSLEEHVSEKTIHVTGKGEMSNHIVEFYCALTVQAY